jgi:arylformamidase
MSQLYPSSLATLNKEYSPSSCIDDINLYIQQYIDLSAEAKTSAIEKKSVLTDLKYGSAKTQSLDLYLPAPTSNHSPQKKLMVYIHGGYWQELSKEESSFAATNFQQQGFYFAVIDYTLAPDATMTEIVEENRKALTWLFNNAKQFGYDPEQIYVSGSSAGAHLAMMMLQTPWSKYIKGYKNNIIKGLCAVSGIYDLKPLVPTYVNEPLKMSVNEADTNSPLSLPLPTPTPVIIAYGDNETDAFKQQSKMMADKLNSEGFNVIFKEITERNHFNVIVDLNNPSTWLAQQTINLMK